MYNLYFIVYIFDYRQIHIYGSVSVGSGGLSLTTYHPVQYNVLGLSEPQFTINSSLSLPLFLSLSLPLTHTISFSPALTHTQYLFFSLSFLIITPFLPPIFFFYNSFNYLFLVFPLYYKLAVVPLAFRGSVFEEGLGEAEQLSETIPGPMLSFPLSWRTQSFQWFMRT